MSQGRFVRTFYELDNGEIARARVQPETIAGFNTPVGGPATVPGSARMQGSRRRQGINARHITGAWVGTPPTGYDDRTPVRVPVMSPAVYNGLELGDTVNYLGASLEIIGKTAEKIA